MSLPTAKTATDDEYYNCFTKANYVIVTKIDQKTWSQMTGGKVLKGIKDSYRIDATIAGDHVRRYTQTWSSDNKSKVCVQSFLYPSHVGAKDRGPETKTATYGRIVAPARHPLGDPSKFRPLKVNSVDGGVANESTESGVGDEECTMEYQGSKEDVGSGR
jgi:hypothetical protein